ncbi:MAG: hypothetical protein V2A78_04035 [bacterium]
MKGRSFIQFLDLVLVSFLILFLELACIRWFPSYLRLLSFFTNFILLACFLGMSIGCLIADRKEDFFAWSGPLLLTACFIVWCFKALGLTTTMGTQLFKDEIFFGAEILETQRIVPLELIVVVFFLLLSLAFVGLGQKLGRELKKHPPLIAYSFNIGGSLIGILAFSVCSYLSTPPSVWFALSLLAFVLLLRDRSRVTRLANLLAQVLLLSIVVVMEFHTIWSPYYKIVLQSDKNSPGVTHLLVNDIGHQFMKPVDQFSLYSIPYILLARSRPEASPDHVLVIGAGTGNDVAHALYNGARKIDAVEIDASIIRLGKILHPEHPYQSDKVSLYNEDGRSFIKRVKEKYDIVLYGLVDSLTLLSTYSSIRLENYLFTTEAFREVKERLKPGGIFVVYNYFREGWLIQRISRMLETVFNQKPLILTYPPCAVIRDVPRDPSDFSLSTFAIFICGDKDGIEKYLREKSVNIVSPNRFPGALPIGSPAPGKKQLYGMKFAPSRLDIVSSHEKLPEDDWPFLYLRKPSLPPHNIKGLLLILLCSLILMSYPGRFRLKDINGHFFFLGSGFMIMETLSITRFALLFGSTWLNNSIVFFSILAMGLCATLVALFRPGIKTSYLYAGVFLSLALIPLVPMKFFLSLPPLERLLSSGLLYFLPIFFGGIIFANSFGKSESSNKDLGSNILGAMLGGVAEYLSLIWGYQHLVLFVAFMYFLSWIFLPKGRTSRGRI